MTGTGLLPRPHRGSRLKLPYRVKFSTGTARIPTRPADKAATLAVWDPPLMRKMLLVADVRLPSVALSV